MAHHIKNIAVTGAKGFLGSEFVRFLAVRFPDCSIHALGDSPKFQNLKNVKVFKGVLGAGKLSDAFLSERQIVFHFAFHGFPSEKPSTPEREVIANLSATTELLEGMRKKNCSKLVLLGSGGAIYSSRTECEQTEMTLTEARTAYAAGKLCNEILADMNQHLYGMETYQLRVSNVYGPGQHCRLQNGFIAKALDCVLNSSEMPLWVGLETKKDFIYTEDLFSALEKFVLPLVIPSGLYNLGGNKTYSLETVLNTIEAVTASKVKTKLHYSNSALSHQTHLDCSKFQSATLWKPTTELAKGISQFWSWYQETHTQTRKVAA